MKREAEEEAERLELLRREEEERLRLEAERILLELEVAAEEER